jgi:acid phosphatase
MMNSIANRSLGLAFCLLLTGCAANDSSNETITDEEAPRRIYELLHSVLWTQTAVEYRASALQSYRRATAMLDEALADPSWTAALEQTGDFSGLPPAVILDVDETVLDNSPYEARLIHQGEMYNLDSWHDWCREEKAAAVPGALEFTRYAADKGVKVFYVTNRRYVVEEATRRNLGALRFPVDMGGDDTLHTRGEIEAWDTSDKGTRREEVASRYRILLLIGDNMGDFLSGGLTSVEERASLFEEHEAYWGTRWIVLPNPQYGSWEGAIIDFEYNASEEERRRRKLDALRTQ